MKKDDKQDEKKEDRMERDTRRSLNLDIENLFLPDS